MRKVCASCDQEKEASEFFVSRKTGRLETICKVCKAARKTPPRSRTAIGLAKRRRAKLSERDHILEHLDQD